MAKNDSYRSLIEENERLRLQVTDLTRTCNLLGENLNEMVMLHHAVRSISGAIIVEDIIHKFLSNIVDSLGFRRVAMFLIDESATVLELRGVTGISRERFGNLIIPLVDSNNQIVRSATQLEKTFLSGFSKSGNDPFLSKFLDTKTRTLIYYPMNIHDKCLGVVVLESVKKVELAQVNLLDLYVGQATLALENAVMFNKIIKINEELKEMDALKSEFISTVSHELRTPLTSIKGGVELVLDKVVGQINDKQEHVLDISKQNVDRLSRLIDDLLDISRIEAGKVILRRKRIDTAQLIERSVMSMKGMSSQKNIIISRPEEKRLGDVFVDEDRIVQVFTNLLSNAIKFSGNDSGIEISVRNINDGKNIEVDVTDHGVGISVNDRIKLFQKFFQIRNEGDGAKGTGLGLAICRELVSMHGGILFLKESFVDKGSTFSFTLPLYEQGMEERVAIEDLIYNEIKRAERLRNRFCIVCFKCDCNSKEMIVDLISRGGGKSQLDEDKVGMYSKNISVCILKNTSRQAAIKWKDAIIKKGAKKGCPKRKAVVISFPEEIKNKDDVIAALEELELKQ